MRRPVQTILLLCMTLLAILAGSTVTGDEKPSFNAAGITPNAEEQKLYILIMRYRAERGLAAIPLSRSLTHVAQVHARDLTDNRPAKGECNMHSWSDSGPWTACCYTSDHRQAACMWNKPKELTTYPGNGYEISHGAWGAAVSAETALRGWKGSPGHNAVIVNEGMWSRDWKAIGIGIYGNYAVAWFGHEEDPAGTMKP